MANDRPTNTEHETHEDGPDEMDTVEDVEREYDEYGHDVEGEDSDWTDYLDETFVAVMLLAGAFLFFVPEPVTSMVGVLLFAAGLGALLVDALS